MWGAIARLVDRAGKIVNSNIAGRLALGAVFGGLVGAFPLAFTLTSGALIPAALMGAGVGALAGFFYHLGHVDADRYWRRQQQLDLEWRIKQEDLRAKRGE